jgi:hypothetical protein
VLRRPFVLLCLAFLAAIDVSDAHAVARQNRAANPSSNQSGTWSATTGGGITLMGTWTAVPASPGDAVTGTWTLVDARGQTVASGEWTAAKSAARWSGAWRAVVSGSRGAYSGTWRASLDVERGARFAALFEHAARGVVSGTWRAGGRSGTWAIRTSERESAP